RRQLEYKAAQRGGMIVVADRWYPSRKTCSDCGQKLETLPLAVSSTVSACGEEGSGLGRKLKTKPASVKQESSSKATYG
ncbi:MAG: zinc ribbon domain-containing protein, partial [Leptospirillum sp.]